MTIKKTILSLVATPFFCWGCTATPDGMTPTQTTEDNPDGEVVAVALLGPSGTTAASDDGNSALETGMNAAIAQNLSQKVEGQLNAMLEAGELDGDKLDGAAKDINAGFNLKRGFFLDIVDERVPFAGGQMVLNGGVDLTIRYLGGGKLALVATGTLSAGLEGVEKEGIVRELPYRLALDGTSTLGIDGSFAVTIKRWKVSSMSADLSAQIIGSDVTATGEIEEREVTASVDMTDLALSVTNPDVLHTPKAFTVACSGAITFTMNDNTLVTCTIAPACTSCE